MEIFLLILANLVRVTDSLWGKASHPQSYSSGASSDLSLQETGYMWRGLGCQHLRSNKTDFG